MNFSLRRRVVLLLVCLLAGLAGSVGCSGDPVDLDGGGNSASFGYGGFAMRPQWPMGGNDGSGGMKPAETGLPCEPPDAVPLPQRQAVRSTSVMSKSRPIFVRDLFDTFKSHCGGCHVDTNLGGFDGQVVTLENFAELITADLLASLKTDDPEKYMPPPVGGGMPWSERSETDGVVQLVQLLETWIAEGSPEDVFFLEPEAAAADTQYLMTPKQGQTMTNLGNCLPDPTWFAQEEDESEALDEKFAAMTQLPKRLAETDLTTWDHAELAYRGIVGFAPAYPLFSDFAGKIRHIRVPRGTHIEYDAATQQFDLPENTRFYKTFLKDVIDADGQVAWRKVETRIIVSRDDDCQGEACTPRSLYGTYAWNETETEAVLVEDPLRDGQPFRDRVITYLTDEKAAAEAGDDPVALQKISRHYAIPGSVRCVQCHQGSVTKDFALGFVPLQTHRRPYVEEPDMFARGADLVGHGVLEEDDPLPDELTQLDRFIELGLVTGLGTADDVPSLRDAGPRPPRNGYELKAQGYLLGNCSNCHNPRGFPSQKHPELRELLDFYPSKDGGGIFEFPLEATSPRVRRGPSGEIAVPYISPSIFDYPADAPLTNEKCPPAFTKLGYNCVEAPWRSLIWRNVDTPFTYADDYAIFPHMPRHGSNHDCRAGNIVGDWMVSIPSIRLAELDPLTGKTVKRREEHARLEQPRMEPPSKTSAQYEAAVEEARARLEEYHQGDRYNVCPDTSDVQAPEVLSGLYSVPMDAGMVLPGEASTYYDAVPDRPHWMVLDNTEVPGDWSPRRGDWKDILLGEDPDKVAALEPEERMVVELLAEAQPTVSEDFRAYALEEEPFGFWKNVEGECDDVLAGMPTGASLPAEERPPWIGGNLGRPLYSIAPGAAVFTNICRNCHGPAGDGDSALAASIAEMSGGSARVANLSGGLLGPLSDPGLGRELVFGEAAEDLDLEVDDLALRYLLWMALGGTRVEIPSTALTIVANTRVLGEFRRGKKPEVSANMLLTAVLLCSAALPAGNAIVGSDVAGYDLLKGRQSVFGMDPLITTSSDAEMWMRLCSYGMRTPVRVLQVTAASTGPSVGLSSGEFIDAAAYGDHPVMTRGGVVDGVAVGEPDAWCIRKPTDEEGLAAAEELRAASPTPSGPVPYCPEGILAMEPAAVERYALRGAMNAGMAAFVYLDAVSRGEVEPNLQYDECHLLQ